MAFAYLLLFAAICGAWSLGLHELQLPTAKFDPMIPQVQQSLLQILGLSAMSVKPLADNHGMNGGVWVLSDPQGNWPDMILKSRLPTERYMPELLPEPEHYLKLARELPSLEADPSLVFPSKIIWCFGPGGAKVADLIFMRKAHGTTLGSYILEKSMAGAQGTRDANAMFEKVGRQLRLFHKAYGMQHTDFQTSNIMVDTTTAADAEGVTTTVTVYLPEHLQGKRVIRSTQSVRRGSYLVDNSELQHSTPGLGYRKSMHIDDRSQNPPLAPWGSVVEGVLQDGWLKAEVQVQAQSENPGFYTILSKCIVGAAPNLESDDVTELKVGTVVQVVAVVELVNADRVRGRILLPPGHKDNHGVHVEEGWISLSVPSTGFKWAEASHAPLVDKAAGTITFIDMGSMGQPADEDDVTHMSETIRLLASLYTPPFLDGAIDHFKKGYHDGGSVPAPLYTPPFPNSAIDCFKKGYHDGGSVQEQQGTRDPLDVEGNAFNVGDAVEVWSNSVQAWGFGNVLGVRAGAVHVAFAVPGRPFDMEKELPSGHADLRRATPSVLWN